MELTVILSTGRCGSTALSHALAEHPDVMSASELFTTLPPSAFDRDSVISGPAFAELLAEPHPLSSLLLQNDLQPDEFLYCVSPSSSFGVETGVPPLLISTLPLLDPNPDQAFDELEQWLKTRPALPARDHLAGVLRWLAERYGKTLIVERSGGSVARAATLVRCFPDARFVFLHRSGVACASSMSRHPVYRLAEIGRDFARRTGCDPYASRPLPSVAPPAVPPELKGLHPADFDRARFLSRRVPLARFGAAWSLMTVRGLRILQQLPRSQVMSMSYERLCAEPRNELRRLADFLGRPHDAWLESAAARFHEPDRAYDPDADLRRAVRPGMAAIDGFVGSEEPGVSPSIG